MTAVKSPYIDELCSRRLRTISHHSASDSGHLSYSKNEELTLIVAVDERWLLCSGRQGKGLVHRSAAVAI